ncbi:hypothetical protein OCH239_12580 [Roseivivax halodurans JCM 10272]|uniref:Uncharacterized protein n=1 Tax=Roseivivax halodurans JCM 10272 TaxID=1449350 RepID=X7EBN0_9RHOB|nr:hypothetical protein [Roseivivax halodurans]ETX13270.1 hypothetical protein OCH239_12580 [Roseivivax halodurans JCM 10272]
MKTETAIPPANTRRIWRVADLPSDRVAATYAVQHGDGSVTHHILSKRRRQVMDLLIEAPVYCASPVRISDIVHLLKRETGVAIHTDYYAGDPNTGAGGYGTYTLFSKVWRVACHQVAA